MGPPLNKYESGFLSRVEPEQRQNNRQQDYFPKNKNAWLEVAKLIPGIVVDDECAERNTDYQPNDLSLSVPH